MSSLPKTDPATILAKLIKLSNSNTQHEFKVGSFLNVITWELDFDHAILLTLDRERRLLEPLWRPDAAFPQLSSITTSADSMIGRCLTGRQTLLADPPDFETLPRDWAAFAEPFRNCLLVTPLGDDKTTYGVLVLLARQVYEVNPVKALLLEAVANELTIAIKSSQLATDTRKRLSVLNVLSDLGRTLSATIEVDRVMAMIPQIASGIFLADGCTLNILDDAGQTLLLSSQHGLIPPAYNFERYRAKALPVTVAMALSRKASFSGYLKDDPGALDLSEAELNNTIISCPLSFQGRHQGSISLFNKLGGHNTQAPLAPQLFDRYDLELLFSMNNMVSGVVENALSFREVQSLARTNAKMVGYLSTLYDISSALMTTVHYDELIWIITRALTDRKGLSFDQVLILLLQEEGESGQSLVSSAFWTGADNLEYSGRGNSALVDILKKPSKEEAGLMLERGREMGLAIPVFPESPRILSRVLVEKKAMLGFGLIDSDSDADLKDFGLKAYAAVPMMGKNRDVGVIAVDRSVSGEPLTMDSLRDLTMLANQAGLAIENARLYSDLENANKSLSQVRVKLIEAEKQAARGEMGTHLAHEVRNPLVSIGGFTQRLLKKMSPDDPLKKYAEVIWEEVERVNKVLNNVLNFSRDEAGLVRDFKMEELLAEALGSLCLELERQKVRVETRIEPNLPEVAADDQQIMHIVLNIFYNATQAMAPAGGIIHLRLYETKENDQSYVACEIADTGPGIPEDILPKIFSPFFTSKSDGTGLGLSIVKKIVDRYHGLIQVENHPARIPGSGAAFTFMFPVSQAGARRT
ncbi:MAG: hypothetical protein LBP55_09400 [Candidatus Adiutrix sp.]|jgi:signal transduction histidine kinase|nr:hypothetical protein [Candidatus Adiutrix sp.]